MESVKFFLFMTLCATSGVKCSLVSVCSDVSDLHNHIPVPIAVDCSSLQYKDLLIEIDFVDNIMRCNTWVINQIPNDSPLLIFETQFYVIVDLMALCLDQQTPTYLQCHILYPTLHNIDIHIHNSMYLFILRYCIELLGLSLY